VKKLLSMSIVLALVLSFSLAATTPVAAQTNRLVPGQYATIQEAVDAASEGDTIIVEAGHVAVEDRLIIMTDGITLTTDKSNPATIRYEAATTHSTVDIRGADVVLENFNIERNSGASGSQAINVRRPGVIVRGTTITGSGNVHGPHGIPGIHLTTGDPGSYDIPLEGVILKDNHISGEFMYGIAVATYTADVSIEVSVDGNTFADLTWDGSYWGWATQPGWAVHIHGIASIDVTITDNTFDDVHGVYVREETGDAVFDVAAHCNFFLGTGNWGIYSLSVFTVDALSNWWGDVDGPGPVGPGAGAHVTDNVLFYPWAKTGPDVPAAEVETETGTGEASFSPSQGCLVELEALPEIPPSPPDGVSFPHGMFSFEITCISPGATVTVTIELPEAVPQGTVWWKYHNGEWYWLRNQTDDGDNIMTIRLTDGGRGDADGSADGSITDPGGPGNPLPAVVGWEGSPVNRLAVMAPWIALLVAIMAGATLLVLRRRRARI